MSNEEKPVQQPAAPFESVEQREQWIAINNLIRTASANPTIFLGVHTVPAAGVQGDIQRYGDNPWAAGSDPEFGPRSDGDYVKLEDVQKLIAGQQPDSGRDAALWDANAEGYMTGLRVGLLEGASILREVYVNHVFHTGVHGFDARCKEAEQVLIEKANAALAAHPAPSSDAGQGVWVGTISSGDIEGDEIDWDAEFDRKVVDALPQLRMPNQHFGLFMAPLTAAHPANGAQAGDAVVLEQAAQACDQQADGTNGPYRSACLACANAVRELRDAAAPQKKEG